MSLDKPEKHKWTVLKLILTAVIGIIATSIVGWSVWVTTGTWAACETSEDNEINLCNLKAQHEKEIGALRIQIASDTKERKEQLDKLLDEQKANNIHVLQEQKKIMLEQKRDNQKIMEMLIDIERKIKN